MIRIRVSRRGALTTMKQSENSCCFSMQRPAARAEAVNDDEAQKIWDIAVQQTIGDVERMLRERGALIPIVVPGGVFFRRL